MDDDKLHKEITMGARAEQMLQGGKVDKLCYNEAVGMLHDELMKRWKASTSAEDRDRIWVATNMLEKLSDTLALMAGNGRMAKQRLEQLISGQ